MIIRNCYRISTEIKYISKGLVIQKQVNNADKLKKEVWLMKHAKSRTEKFCSIGHLEKVLFP